MKNLKMFAIGLAAFAAMTMGVHATDTNCIMPEDYNVATAGGKSKCVVAVGEEHYDNFADAWKVVSKDGGEITLLDSTNAGAIGSAYALKNVTINLVDYSLNLGNWYLGATDGATLTITGSDKAVLKTTATDYALIADADSKVVVNGALTIDFSTASKPLVEVAGEASIIGGTTISVATSSTAIFSLTSASAKATLDAKVGSVSRAGVITAGATKLVDATAEATTSEVPTFTITGGEYYVTSPVEVDNGMNLIISGGKIVSGQADSIVKLIDGDVTISGGTLENKTSAKSPLWTFTNAKGNLTITGGTFTSDTYYAFAMSAKDVKISITGGTFNGGKRNGEQMPALYIADTVLTGLAKPAVADNFKGILTGGKYLVSIIGGAKISGISYSAATVQNYVVAEGATVTEDGDYKVINAKVEDQNAGDGEQTPAPETNPNVPDVPKTNDNILVYASLGVVSALSVGFTAKRKENN